VGVRSGEIEGDEEPEGRQYARAGRPFLMMRPAAAAIADFSNSLPDDDQVCAKLCIRMTETTPKLYQPLHSIFTQRVQV
jgi:hypothetical protein